MFKVITLYKNEEKKVRKNLTIIGTKFKCTKKKKKNGA